MRKRSTSAASAASAACSGAVSCPSGSVTTWPPVTVQSAAPRPWTSTNGRNSSVAGDDRAARRQEQLSREAQPSSSGSKAPSRRTSGTGVLPPAPARPWPARHHGSASPGLIAASPRRASPSGRLVPLGQVPVAGRGVPGEVAAGEQAERPARGPSAGAVRPASRGPAQTPARRRASGRARSSPRSVARAREVDHRLPLRAHARRGDPLPQLGPGERPVGGQGSLDHPSRPFSVGGRDALLGQPPRVARWPAAGW